MITKYVTLTGAFLGYFVTMKARDLLHLKLMIEGSCLKTMYCHWYTLKEIREQMDNGMVHELHRFNQQGLNYDTAKVEAEYKRQGGDHG